MNNTALGAGAKNAQEIIFISEAHEKFYYEKLKEVRCEDINPIKEDKSGTLQTYLPEAEQYLAKKQETQEKPKRISIKEKLKGKQAEVNKNAANKHKSVAHGKNNIDL